MSIGVVICYYEQPAYIQESLASIRLQTRPPDHVVIVDDGSLLSPLRGEAINLSVPFEIIQVQNGGVSAARNRGLASLATSLAMVLDADDVLAPTYLEELSTALERSGRSIAYSDIWTFGTESTIYRHPPYSYDSLKSGNFMVNAALMRHQVWEDVRTSNGEGFDTVLDRIGGYEDHLFWLEAGSLGHAGVHVPFPLFGYRRHLTSKLTSARRVFPRVRKHMAEKMHRLYRVELPELIGPAEP